VRGEIEEDILESELFEWDDWKAAQNRMKHGVDFAEAATVFDDELVLEFDDTEHSRDEPRTILIGRSIQSRILLVVYTQRVRKDGVERYRIISARKAAQTERTVYEAQRQG
jgi:uncharacterized DUF497 family protein